ncbi:hypothetical protein X777_11565 [Ooceraea biroi]|uniref:Uncharacterized protein n=1 Tax=Ooceraea biroi TaxID=2015173 RepID=A0A026W232_OOCBI|nr:hypothetical protein X777_11565 [Ooceraea biroi]
MFPPPCGTTSHDLARSPHSRPYIARGVDFLGPHLNVRVSNVQNGIRCNNIVVAAVALLRSLVRTRRTCPVS